MTYQVIARKWRPQTFDEVTGQDHVTTPLRNAIRNDRIPHALLLTGPRGVGKTTLARILARCLNCEKGPCETPCGSCDPCQDITSGRSTDVQEIDAASRTGVDDMREVIESIRYAPTPGKYRIFVVDEVHMLSTAAFNALLKTLEEPPPRSLFVFATTNPEKIPFTVLSRCQRYDLRRIAAPEVARSLGAIAKAEGITISEQSLLAIAREGEGSMRDSQTLLDQVISYGGEAVDDEVVSQVLDLIDRNVLIAIASACVDSDPQAVLLACARATEKGSDPKRLGAALIQLLRDLVVLRLAKGEAENLVSGSPEEIAQLEALADRSDPIRLRRMFRTLVKEQEDLAWAPQPFAVLEMALVRLATLPSGEDVAQLVARLESLEKRIAAGGGGAGPAGGAGGPAGGGRPAAPRREAPRSGGGRAGGGSQAAADVAPTAGREHSEPAAASSAAGPTPPSASAPAAPASPPARSGPAVASSPAQSTPPSPPALAPSSRPVAPVAPTAREEEPLSGEADGSTPGFRSAEDVASLEAVMDRLMAMAKKENPPLHHSLASARLVSRAPDALEFSANSPFHVKRLEDRLEELEELTRQFFGKTMKLKVSRSEGGGGASGSAPAAAVSREAERKRKHAALNHPAINLALRELQGEIVEIRPISGKRSEKR